MAIVGCKGPEAALALRRLKGLSPRMARELFTSTVALVVDYASNVWMHEFRYRRASAIQRVQRIGAQAILLPGSNSTERRVDGEPRDDSSVRTGALGKARRGGHRRNDSEAIEVRLGSVGGREQLDQEGGGRNRRSNGAEDVSAERPQNQCHKHYRTQIRAQSIVC